MAVINEDGTPDYVENETLTEEETLPLARKELDAACDKIKQRTCDTVGLLTAAVLRDEFDFGPKRAKRFWDRFNSKTECIMSDMATWDDYQKMVKEELGLNIELHENA